MLSFFPLSIMQIIEQNHILHLTGSRYLEIHTPESNWDFMIGVDAEKETAARIIAEDPIGIQDITSSYGIPRTHAPIILCINIHRDLSVNLQILSRRLCKQKIEAQCLIKNMLKNGFKYPVERDNKTKVWAWAMNEAALKACKTPIK